MKKKIVAGILITGMTMSMAGCGLFGDVMDGDGMINTDFEDENVTDDPVDSDEDDLPEFGEVGDAGNPGDVDVSGSESDYSEYEELYTDVLNSVKLFLLNDADEGYYFNGAYGIEECAMYSDNALEAIGYTIYDISGDGIPELIVGSISGNGLSSNILAIWSIMDGRPEVLCEGWSRNYYTYMGNGQLFYMGSGGYMYQAFGSFYVDTDGSSLVTVDYYYTQPEINNGISYHYSNVGEYDDNAKEISEKEFYDAMDELDACVDFLAVTPFSEYEGVVLEGNNDPGYCLERVEAFISGDFLVEDPADLFSDYIDVELGLSGDTVKVALYSDVYIEQINFYEIIFGDYNVDAEMGVYDMSFITGFSGWDDIYPLCVDLKFYGDLPTYGFSVKTEDGKTYFYSVGMSGYDGSIEITQIIPGVMM